MGSEDDVEYADVLVVDDDDGVRASTAEVVRSGGYSVRVAKDGMSALELLHSMRFGLVLLDIQMPRLSGLQVLAMHNGNPPVVVLSAHHHDATTVPDGTDVFMFLRKPVQPAELLEVVTMALAGPAA